MLTSVSHGTVITFYPGLFFPPLPDSMTLSTEYLESEELVSLVKPRGVEQSSYLINSVYGGFLNDPLEMAKFLREHNTGAESETGSKTDSSSLWLGHRVQHPPRNVKPNVEVLHFKWVDVHMQVHKEKTNAVENGKSCETSNIDAVLADKILRGTRMYEGTHYIDHRGDESRTANLPTLDNNGDKQAYWRFMNGIALITSRDIAEGEELYLDYQYSAAISKELKWYHEVKYT